MRVEAQGAPARSRERREAPRRAAPIIREPGDQLGRAQERVRVVLVNREVQASRAAPVAQAVRGRPPLRDSSMRLRNG